MCGSQANEGTPVNETQPIAMNAARKTIAVSASIAKVYEQWLRFENLPRFITPLRHVQRIDETRFCFTCLPTALNNKMLFRLAANFRAGQFQTVG